MEHVELHLLNGLNVADKALTHQPKACGTEPRDNSGPSSLPQWKYFLIDGHSLVFPGATRANAAVTRSTRNPMSTGERANRVAEKIVPDAIGPRLSHTHSPPYSSSPGGRSVAIPVLGHSFSRQSSRPRSSSVVTSSGPCGFWDLQAPNTPLSPARFWQGFMPFCAIPRIYLHFFRFAQPVYGQQKAPKRGVPGRQP